jgi:flagellin-specific chaperone FliS
MTVPYKNKNDADELAYLMDKALRADEAEVAIGSNNITEGIDCLSKAANILEHLNEKQAAEAITVLIEKMVGRV